MIVMMQYYYYLNLFAPWKAEDVEQVVCIMLRDSHYLPIDCLHIYRRIKAAYNYITTTEKIICFTRKF